MSWRNRWPDRQPRPKAAKLPKEKLQRLHGRAVKFVQESLILRELVGEVKLARRRLYLWPTWRAFPDNTDRLSMTFSPLQCSDCLLASPGDQR